MITFIQNNSVVHVIQLLALLALVAGYGYYTNEFRFDYEFSEEADGWLKYHIIPSTWADARMQCHGEGAVLASPLSKSLKSAIISFVMKQNHLIRINGAIAIFSGVHSTYSSGVYTSVKGVPLSRMDVTWYPEEPNNCCDENCLIMVISDNGTMADARCDGVLPYVCYKKNTTLQLNRCGTTDLAYKLDKNTGSCYKFHSKTRIWSEAFKICQAEGAYLAIINSDVEADVITKFINGKWPGNNFKPKLFPTDIHIGYRDWSIHWNFMTIHGQTLNEAGFQKWANDEPSNDSNPTTGDINEMCGGYNNHGEFNNVHCNLPRAFLCEMNINSLL